MKKNKGKIEQTEKTKQKSENKQTKIENQWQSIKKQGNGYIITVGAKPNSKQTKVTEVNSQHVGISIAAPPRQGEANEQLVDYVAKLFNAKKSGVYVDKGGKSRNKMVVIQECKLSFEQILQKIKSQI